ncbi:MAG: hypothetical protein WBB07_17695 [Mycobacterium sp.]
MRWVYGGGLGIILATFLADGIGLPVDYRLAANWSLTFFAVFVTAFTIRYGFWSNWRANRIGVILLAKSVFLSVAVWQIVASTWIGQDYPYRQQIRFIIYAFGALSYLTMVVTLWREQRRDRAELSASVFDRRK